MGVDKGTDEGFEEGVDGGLKSVSKRVSKRDSTRVSGFGIKEGVEYQRGLRQEFRKETRFDKGSMRVST